MAANFGLLAGIDQGLKEGLRSYQEESRYQDEKSRREKSDAQNAAFRRLEAKRQGYDFDPETNEFSATATQAAKDAREADLYDPSSSYSQSEREKARGLLKGTRYAGLISDEMTPEQVKGTLAEVNPFLTRDNATRLASLKNSTSKQDFANLPKENQVQVSSIANLNANKKSISNQLKADLGKLNDPSLNDEQKLVYARQMIKTLNSQQGKDAVGQEEAKRLSSLLEYHWFNLTNPGPITGRAPISDFANQVQNTVEGIDKSVELNNQEIDRLYGRGSSQMATSPQGPDDATVNAYAARYKLDPEHARAILSQRMSGGGGASGIAGR